MQAEIAKQVETGLVAPGLDPLNDVGCRRRLLLEVASDDLVKLLQRLEHRKIEIREVARREHQPAMAVHHKGPHDELLSALESRQ